MKRRDFITALGAISLAGCSEVERLQPTPRVETRTVVKTRVKTKIVEKTVFKTRSPTPSPTTTSKPPEPNIIEVSLISDWKQYGDVFDNQISEISPEEDAVIGARFEVVCDDENELRWRNRIEITKDGDVVASNTAEAKEFTTNCRGTETWEQAQTLYYNNEYDSKWEVGTYTAEVRIDDFYGKEKESVSMTTQFDVVPS